MEKITNFFGAIISITAVLAIALKLFGNNEAIQIICSGYFFYTMYAAVALMFILVPLLSFSKYAKTHGHIVIKWAVISSSMFFVSLLANITMCFH